jgi:hypothetical protein
MVSDLMDMKISNTKFYVLLAAELIAAAGTVVFFA